MAYKGYSKRKAEAIMRAKELDRNVIGEGEGFARTPNVTGPTRRALKCATKSGTTGPWYFGIAQSRKLVG